MDHATLCSYVLHYNLSDSSGNAAEELVDVGSIVGEYKTRAVNQMVAQWVSHAKRNGGLILNSEAASQGSCRYFSSSPHNDPSQRPRLVATCRTSRGQNLYWEDNTFVIEMEDWLSDRYVAQSGDEPGGPWFHETGLVISRWWQSGDVGPSGKGFSGCKSRTDVEGTRRSADIKPVQPSLSRTTHTSSIPSVSIERDCLCAQLLLGISAIRLRPGAPAWHAPGMRRLRGGLAKMVQAEYCCG